MDTKKSFSHRHTIKQFWRYKIGYLGIDLGTTNSVAVIYDDKTDLLEVVKFDGVDELLPSVVNYIDDEVIVGSEAKAGAIIYPETTISSVKKLMGTDKKIMIGSKEMLPEEISGDILRKLKEAAEEQSGEVYDEVVITHPAYFNDSQIFATQKAGELAGFSKTFLLSEPLAAAIEYGYKEGYAQTILVYDLGGGTFDACVLKVSLDENSEETFQELADVGDMNLGGDDFDGELVELFKAKFEEENKLNIDTLESLERKRVIQKLKQEAEVIKKKLSVSHNATVSINPLLVYEGVPKNLVMDITREDFENIIRKYVDRSREIMEEALKRSGRNVDDITKVILVGGSSLIPMIRRMVAGSVKEPYSATDPAKSVAMGGAIYNYLIHLPSSNVNIGQITRQIIGTEAIVNIDTMEKKLIPIIKMGTNIPCNVSDDNFINYSSNVNVNVYQWEQGYENEKKLIGIVKLSNIEKNTKMELTYKIDENNIFGVSVKDTNTGISEEVVFDRNSEVLYEEVTESSTYDKINVTFMIDTTGSMDNYINGVKERASEFANILARKGATYQLGLIGFGDLYEKEKPSVYKFTDNVELFQRQVNKIPRTYGGDIPESSLDALETGIELLNSSNLDKDANNIFILITDAPPHIPTFSGKTVEALTDMLNKNKVTTYIVCGRDKVSREAFSAVVGDRGKVYNMREDFYNILDNIAKSITELVRI